MTPIDKLTRKYKFNPSNFDTAKDNYYTFCMTINNPNYSIEKSEEAYKALYESFVQILDIAASESQIRENLSLYTPTLHDIPISVTIATDTSDINITMVLFQNFYVATAIKSPQNIKFMKDEFWSLLFQLSAVGTFRFKEKELPDKTMRKKHPQLFNKTGNYYKFLRNYFLFEANYGRIRDLGSIAVSWESTESFDVLIPKICDAVKIMYRLNFLLWKHDNKNVRLNHRF